MSSLPLIRYKDKQSIVAHYDGNLITASQFLMDVIGLEKKLPEHQYILNLCSDRYRFTVGLCAALLRKQISLLPPNYTPELIEQLTHSYPDIYCLSDSRNKCFSLNNFFYDGSLSSENSDFFIPDIPASQIAALVFTSGSTGVPVGHPKTWENLVKSALAEIHRLQLDRFEKFSVLGTVPPQHMYGLESTVLMLLQAGHALINSRPFYPVDICNALEALPRPRGLVTTPVHLRAMLKELDKVPAVDFLLCATAPLSPQLALEAETKFLAPLYEIYGCTEAGQVATRRSTEGAKWFLLEDLKMRQEQDKTLVSGGHVNGEILLNDIIEITNKNTFLLHGRAGDLINIAGKRTSLANLNYHLNSIEGVDDGVFVMPDLENVDGSVPRLMAFVVAPALTKNSLIKALRERIDSAFIPRPLYFVKALPRNTTGKLTKEALNNLRSCLVKKIIDA